MQIDIRDRVVVVTGAAQGIGRTLALGLAAEGARVAVLARGQQRADAVAAEIAALPDARPALAVDVDLADEDAVVAAAAAVDETYGRVDALVNNAGWMGGGAQRRVLDMSSETLDRILRSNVVTAFLATKHFAPLMIRGGGGRIVYLSSIIGVAPGPGAAAYGGAKAAINILTNVTHQELANDGIRTVAIAPGLTETPGMQEIVTPEHRARVAAAYPGGRLGQPEDIVGLAAFLCSDLAEHLSGTVVTVRPPA